MIGIGIDPGIATTGYGIVECKGNAFSCLGYGVIKTDKNIAMPKRLSILGEELSFIIKKYNPTILGIEKVYFFKNLKTIIPVSQAKGVIMMTAEREGVPVQEFTPPEIKSSIAGYGQADKEQVQKMIQLLLNLKEKPQPDDAADALGAAICGINKSISLF